MQCSKVTIVVVRIFMNQSLGLTDLPKSGCAIAHLAHPGKTGLLSSSFLMVTGKDSSVPNRHVGLNKRADGKILKKH